MESPSEGPTPKPARNNSAGFPNYLPKPDETILKWIGQQLKNGRGQKTVAQIAKAVGLGVDADVIERIESGISQPNLGLFRQIIRRGYGLAFENLLARCYSTFSEKLGKRRFDRDFYYAVCLQNVGKHKPTPFLVGGDIKNFLWAVPFRKLKKQPLAVEFLELVPSRIRQHSGETPGGIHDGVEVVHVINGTIRVYVNIGEDDPAERELKKGDSIHFNSNNDHSITNCGTTTSALLLIVRLSEPPQNQSLKSHRNRKA
jgi:hypothetical protein